MKKIALVATALVMSGAGVSAQAATLVVKEYQVRTWATGNDNENTVAKVSGMTFGGQVSTAADLGGTSIVIAGSWNSMLKSWVSNGGFLIVHDWSGTPNALPGLSGATGAAYDGGDLNVVDASHPIITGPGGTITNSTLDNGSSSTHGAYTLSSLKTSSDPLAGPIRAILSSGSATSISAFEYAYGSGHILYSKIPLEAYTDSSPLNTGPQPAGLRIYAQNELAYAASTFSAPSAVPEPSTWAMMLVGFGGVGFAMRRQRKADARIAFA